MAHMGIPSGEQRRVLMKDVLRFYGVESTPQGLAEPLQLVQILIIKGSKCSL